MKVGTQVESVPRKGIFLGEGRVIWDGEDTVSRPDPSEYREVLVRPGSNVRLLPYDGEPGHCLGTYSPGHRPLLPPRELVVDGTTWSSWGSRK